MTQPHHPGRDLSQGSIPRHILSLAIPMLIGNLLNTGYGIINTIWVGKILGEAAVGATATSFPVIFVFISVAFGVTMATTILVSQYYGAKNFAMVERTVATSFSLSLIVGLGITVAGILSSDHILRLMNTPADIFPLASPYLKITMGSFIFMYISFLVVSILRGIGDTKTPLAFMGIGVVLNAILDPLLIIGIGPFPRWGLNGAAAASVISSIAAFLAGVIYLNRKGSFVALRPSRLTLDGGIIVTIARIGFPSMIQQLLVSIASAFVTTFVNGFGAIAIAAYGASGRIESLAFMPAMTFSMAISAFTGQNLGARRPERVAGALRSGLCMVLSLNAVIAIVVVAIPHLLLSLFINDPAVIGVGVAYLRITAISYLLFGAMFACNGVAIGAGHTLVTMTFTLVSLWVIRVPLAAWLSHGPLGIIGIWIAIDVSFFVVMCVSIGYYLSGRWKKSIVRHGAPKPLEVVAEEAKEMQ